MKQTGIIMSGDHPKLILDGRKTMTRRVIKHPAIPNSDIVGVKEYLYVPAQEHPSEMDVPEGYYALLKCNANQDRNTTYFRSPYGQVGDRLWVRETHAIAPISKEVIYLADVGKDYIDLLWQGAYWRPSIHMPRWASRITLEITEVRVERLQEIAADDCLAEGIEPMTPFELMKWGQKYRSDFCRLWDSLNAKRGYGWEVNPWVWVISFKVGRGA